MFVEMYGLPSYNGFNPTMLVAVTYTLLFGIMFGDLGQGLVISLVGYFVYRKKGNLLWRYFTACRTFQCIFWFGVRFCVWI